MKVKVSQNKKNMKKEENLSFKSLDSPCSLRLLDRMKTLCVPDEENKDDFIDENVQYHPNTYLFTQHLYFL